MYREKGVGMMKIVRKGEWEKEIGVDDRWACMLRLYEQFGNVWREGKVAMYSSNNWLRDLSVSQICNLLGSTVKDH